MAKPKETAEAAPADEAKTTGTAVGAAANTAVGAYDYGDDAGQGFEKPTADELSIPFLAVLQALSPQVDPETGIAGAAQGMLFNTVTEQLYKGKEGVSFIPSYKTHLFVEWVPRDKGGGIVGFHEVDSAEVAQAKAEAKQRNDKFGKLKRGENDLIETYYLYGLVDGEQMAVISFSSTKIKVLRNWFTKIYTYQIKQPDGRKIQPPLFAHQVRISTEKQENASGIFYNLVMKPEIDGNVEKSLLAPSDPRFQEARNICDMVKGGLAKAAFDTQEKTGGTGNGAAGSSDGTEEDIPF